MEIKTIFKKYKPDFNKLEKSALKTKNGDFKLEKIFKDNSFKAIITISKDKVEGKVIEIEEDDEFLPLRNENNKGSYVGEIREEYKKILYEIRDRYFYKNCFVLTQSNRICELINKKYDVEPEFLWEKSDGSGVFRNSKTNKWFGIIMDIDKSKINKTKKGFVEVMNVKLSSESLEYCLKFKGFYPAYHMNKKYWITFLLDETISDNKIMELIDESYNLTNKK